MKQLYSLFKRSVLRTLGLSSMLFLTVLAGTQVTLAQSQKQIPIHGTVVDENRQPLAGVLVMCTSQKSGGTYTNQSGSYSILIPSTKDSLRFSMIGYKTITIVASESSFVQMKEQAVKAQDVIVTGIVPRKEESYTGAAKTISSKEIIRSGNSTVFQSIRNLDPTLNIFDNMVAGSDPNVMPRMQMRGSTSLPNNVSDMNLKGNYQSIPNQPLFMLDGFKTTIERVVDMDINRIESITFLKDAAAKAIYGSEAANGVVVIETKRIAGNEPIISYRGSLDISAPDLTSYNLTNAAQKLEVERLEGLYYTSNTLEQIKLSQLYNERKRLIAEGLDTYWLSKPLQVGIGHKHTLSVELGDARNLRANLDFSYNKIVGVMKGTDRQNVQGNIGVQYKIKNLIFKNVMTVNSNKSLNSPWGPFGSYTKMNPYWQAIDPQTGEILRFVTNVDNETLIGNPMYDALIGTLDKETYLDFVNNFSIEYSFLQNFKLRGRMSLAAKRSDADEFKPAKHSSFVDMYKISPTLAGSYRLDNGKSSDVSTDVNLTYSKDIGKHSLFGDVGFFLTENSYSVYKNTAVGFPGNQGADITFAKQYAEGSKPEGVSSIKRSVSALAMANYMYDDRYFLDLTYRMTGSSLFGTQNRWTPGWAVGIGWNIQNEKFLKGNSVLTNLKLRASIGVTGNQNFDANYAIGTYGYINSMTYNGYTGAYLKNLPNPELRMERRNDRNIGLDIALGGLSATLDYYNSITEDMVTLITVPPSTGFSSTYENLGRVKNEGFEVALNYRFRSIRNGFLNVFGSLAYNKNTILELSDAMREYNAQQEKLAMDKANNRPVLKFTDGQDLNTIWAVPSLGIDPQTGREVYIKQDGSLTYEYSSSDLRAYGTSIAPFNGVVGFNAEYKGFGMNVAFRFKFGGQRYNQTLIDRVENVNVRYNVDARVFEGRWKQEGDIAKFKRLGTFQYPGDPVAHQEMTRATSRFVQKDNEFTLGSITLYYEFDRQIIKKAGMKQCRISLYSNDVYTWSTIQQERGLDYPFARTFSCSLLLTF